VRAGHDEGGRFQVVVEGAFGGVVEFSRSREIRRAMRDLFLAGVALILSFARNLI
jgi:hypothetical protein